MEKNVKRGERRAILRSLGDEANTAGFESRIHRGRRLDKSKIERWRKREGLAVGSSQTRLLYRSGKLLTYCDMKVQIADKKY